MIQMAFEQDNDSEMYLPKQTLAEALESEPLPIVVRTLENYKRTTFTGSRSEINAGTILYLESQKTIKCVHIKVLDVQDEEAAIQEHGNDFVYERACFVDNEFLIPLKYAGKLKHVLRPGRRDRYANVAQVLEDMPRLIRTEEDTIAVPPGGSGQNTLVPALTVLKVKGRLTLTNHHTEYLQCTEGPATYSFSENAQVNFTAIQDPATYTLTDVVKSLHYPEVMEFQSIKDTDIVHFDDDMASAMMLVAQGPIEILGQVNIEVLIGWVRDPQLRTYKTIVIPVEECNIEVDRRRLEGAVKESFLRRKLTQCPDTSFTETSLYMIELKQRSVVWLKSPKLFVQNKSGLSLKTALKIKFEDSTDEDDEGDNEYIEIRPPIPKRVPLHKGSPDHQTSPVSHSTTSDIKDNDPCRHEMKRKKHLFQHVHFELRHWFKKKKKKGKNHKKQEADVEESKSLSQTTEQNIERRPSLPPLPVKSYAVQVQKSPSLSSYDTLSNGKLQKNFVNNEQKTETKKSHSQDEEIPPAIPPRPKVGHMLPLDSITENVNRTANRQSPEYTKSDDEGSDEIDENIGSDYLTPLSQCEIINEKKSRPYIDMNISDMRKVIGKGQGSEEFYDFSVMQVCHLFRHCLLKSIADVCHEHRLDGRFFKDFDLDEMMKAPFNASQFDVKKVKQIIFNGWRPKVE